jgi:hypothetical protein
LSTADLIDALRNAAACGTLLVVTGAGISKDLRRPDNQPLPSWGELVQSLRGQADASKLAHCHALLDDLLPPAALDKVHGDALIEASEIIQGGFSAGGLEIAIAKVCGEADGTFTETHRAVAQLQPAGVITFNYDRGHEEAFKDAGRSIQVIRYDEDQQIKARLAGSDATPFVLKAHGCITVPQSLVLTSSSYHAVLSKHRAYRLFLQHCLARYTVLVVGFALRDRDFDQLLSSLEIELGKPLQRHAFIAREPDSSKIEGLTQRADWAAITARFGLEPIYVQKFTEIPDVIRSLAAEPGSLIHQLVAEASSSDAGVRRSAHQTIRSLGRTGRSQMLAALVNRLQRPGLTLTARSEVVYAFVGIVGDHLPAIQQLLTELELAAAGATTPDAREQAECAAHALIALRHGRVCDTGELEAVLQRLRSPGLLEKLKHFDDMVTVPRLRAYAESAAAELESRSVA